METIRLKNWSIEDLICDKEERPIWSKWDLYLAPSSNLIPLSSTQDSSPEKWSHPPLGFFKLNFDGASKGNPGPTGFGLVFRDDQG